MTVEGTTLTEEGYVSENFPAKELRCKCGCNRNEVGVYALVQLQKVREAYGKPMVLTSAYRCEKHPVEAGKSTVGQHRLGTAFDIRVNNGAESYELIRLGLLHGCTGFALGNGFVHLDWRQGTPVSWVY